MPEARLRCRRHLFIEGGELEGKRDIGWFELDKIEHLRGKSTFT